MRATESPQVLDGHQYTPDVEQAVQIGDLVFTASKSAQGVVLNGVDIEVESDWLPGDLFSLARSMASLSAYRLTAMPKATPLTGRGAAVKVLCPSFGGAGTHGLYA